MPWETVDDSISSMTTSRLAVPGGWLYMVRNLHLNMPHHEVVFVPDPRPTPASLGPTLRRRRESAAVAIG